MIIWTENGPFPDAKANKEILNNVVDCINKRVKKEHSRITIREVYNMLGINIYNSNEFFTGEFFVNPDDWGWDDKGFRQLYRTITIREVL